MSAIVTYAISVILLYNIIHNMSLPRRSLMVVTANNESALTLFIRRHAIVRGQYMPIPTCCYYVNMRQRFTIGNTDVVIRRMVRRAAVKKSHTVCRYGAMALRLPSLFIVIMARRRYITLPSMRRPDIIPVIGAVYARRGATSLAKHHRALASGIVLPCR